MMVMMMRREVAFAEGTHWHWGQDEMGERVVGAAGGSGANGWKQPGRDGSTGQYPSAPTKQTPLGLA